MAEEFEIGKLNLDFNSIIEDAVELKKQLDELRESQKKARKEGETSTEEYVKQDAEIRSLSKEYNTLRNSMAEMNRSQKTGLDYSSRVNSALMTEATTIRELRAHNKTLNDLRNDANINTEEGQKTLAKLNAQLDKNNVLIKGNVDEYTRQKISIGNYSVEIKEALLSNDLFGESIGDINKAFGMFAPLASMAMNLLTGWNSQVKTTDKSTKAYNATNKMSIISVQALSGAFRLLKIAIASTGIGLLVIALASLVTWLTTTQSGMNQLARITKPLQEVFKFLLSIFQDIGKVVFTSPLDSLKSIYDFIKKQVMVVAKGLWDVLAGIATLDFDRVEKGMQDIKDNANENGKALRGMWDQFIEGADEAWERGKRVQELTEQIAEGEIALVEATEDYTDAMIEQEKIVRDRYKSTAEREAAANKMIELTGEQIKLETTQAQMEVDRLKLVNEATESSYEDRMDLVNAEAKLKQIARKQDKEEITLLRQFHQIRVENNKEYEKQLEKQIKQSQDLLNIRKEESDFIAKSLSEQLTDWDKFYSEQVELEKEKLRLNKISQEDYDLFIRKSALEREEYVRKITLESVRKALREEIELLESNYDEKARLTEAEIQKRIEHNAELNKIEREELESQNKLQLISQEDLDIALRELDSQEYEFRKELEAERREQDRLEELELAELDLENKLQRIQEGAWLEFDTLQEIRDEQFEIEKSKLDHQHEQGVISEEIYLARLRKLNADNSDKEIKDAKILAKQRIDIQNMAFDAISNFAKEGSGIAKAIAIAEALRNTYAGITVGLRAPTLPQRIIETAFASSVGFKAVSDIKSTNVEGGGGSSPSSTISAPSLSVSGGGLDGSSSSLLQSASNSFDMDAMSQQIANAVREGSQQGTSEGLTNRERNISIEKSSSY